MSPAKNADPPQGYEPSMPKTVAEPKPKKKIVKGSGPSELEVQIVARHTRQSSNHWMG